ncbi:MAG: hypothetical protein J6U17_00880 [Kiritimatiellae bacterium]|nr:hypothetical protein [Kiritimatiellia bacterium]
MFIKLTKKDGSPVWINASFLVTVEPSRFGGSVVVPIGDGLDYDVREKPEEILALASGAPTPAVVPVPPPAALAVSRDPQPAEPPTAESAPAEPVAEAPAAEPPKRKRAVRKTKAAKAAEEASAEDAPPPEEGEGASAEPSEEAAKPARKATRTRAKAAAKKPKFEFPDEYLARLRKLAPGSVRKFNNTLLSQFKIDDPEPVMLYLVDRKVISLDNDHIIWLAPDPATIPENVADLVVG